MGGPSGESATKAGGGQENADVPAAGKTLGPGGAGVPGQDKTPAPVVDASGNYEQMLNGISARLANVESHLGITEGGAQTEEGIILKALASEILGRAKSHQHDMVKSVVDRLTKETPATSTKELSQMISKAVSDGIKPVHTELTKLNQRLNTLEAGLNQKIDEAIKAKVKSDALVK